MKIKQTGKTNIAGPIESIVSIITVIICHIYAMYHIIVDEDKRTAVIILLLSVITNVVCAMRFFPREVEMSEDDELDELGKPKRWNKDYRH